MLLWAETRLLQWVGGASRPHRLEHVAVVGQRVHPGYRHLPGRQQVWVGALHLFLLQRETETS